MYINAEELVKVTLLILIVGMFKSKQNKTMHMEAQLCLPPPFFVFNWKEKHLLKSIKSPAIWPYHNVIFLPFLKMYKTLFKLYRHLCLKGKTQNECIH